MNYFFFSTKQKNVTESLVTLTTTQIKLLFVSKREAIELTSSGVPSRYRFRHSFYSFFHFLAQQCCTPWMLHRREPGRDEEDYEFLNDFVD